MVIISNKLPAAIKKLKNHKLFISWRWKLFATFILMSFVPVLFFFGIMFTFMQDYYKNEREAKLLQMANIIAASAARANALTPEARDIAVGLEVESKSKEGGFRVLVFDARGVVTHDSAGGEADKTLLVPEVMAAFKTGSRVNTRVREETTYAATAVLNEASEKTGAVLVVGSVNDIFMAMSDIRNKILLFAAVTAIVITILVFFISKLLLGPFTSFLKVVQKVSEGHLNERIRTKGNDEFTKLGQAFNEMAEKLEEVEKTRAQFVSDVSHEMKTPLSSIKVLTESILLEENVPIDMYKEFLQDINSEIDRMTDIVNDLLNLVKLDQREVPMNIKLVDMNKLVSDILKRLLPLAKQKDIELLVEDVRAVTADCDEMKMGLAISNLVENSIKYTPEGGTVKVVVNADHQNVFITVADTGVGIREEEIPKIFTRFYRVDKTRDRETGGTGLGLAITHATVLLHNGSIKVTSKENEGTTFVVRIPIHRPNIS